MFKQFFLLIIVGLNFLLISCVPGPSNTKLAETSNEEINSSLIKKQTNASNSSELQIIRDKENKIIGVTHTQRHYIIPKTLAKHSLWKKAGMNIEDSSNKMLLPTKEGAKYSTTKRSIHEGKHFKEIEDHLEKKMDIVLKAGIENQYSQEQYKESLHQIINDEYRVLKSGERALNKNARPWAKRIIE